MNLWDNDRVAAPMTRESMQASLDRMCETAAKESGLQPSFVAKQHKAFCEMVMLTLFGPPTEEGDYERES